MSRTIYALLVGVDDYLGGVPRLNGCVNDIARVREFLELRTQGGELALATRVLTAGDPSNPAEQKPTRQAVIQAFREHLGQAGEGDVALFYYSGHGSQERAPEEFWHLEPDRMDETLVLYDSRTSGGWDLADKELAVLIADVARNNPHILVVLDSCHSGSGTRAAEGVGVRLAEADLRHRPLDTFIEGVVPAVKSWSEAAGENQQADRETGKWFTLPEGRHVVLAACRPEELARELRTPDGQVRGALSYYLLDTLQQAGPDLTYRDIFTRTSSLLRSSVKEQNPLLASTQIDDLSQPFLGGAIVPQKPNFFIERTPFRGWVLKAGAIHGIARPVGEETTYLSIFPLQASLAVGGSLEGMVGLARVVEVGAAESLVQIEPEEGQSLDDQVYKAVVTVTPLPPIELTLSGSDEPALQALRAALADSTLVRVSDEPSATGIRVTAQAEEQVYQLARAADRQPLAVEVPEKGTPRSVREAAAKVEHIAQWLQVLHLDNKQSQIPPNAVEMDVYSYDPETAQSVLLDPSGPVRLSYPALPDENDEGAYVQIRLRHTGQYPRKLYCMLLNLTDDFGVAADASLFGGGIWLEPGQEIWASDQGRPYLEVYIPSELVAKGVSQIRDVVKLIVSTDDSDAILLKQEGLEVVVDAATRGLETSRKAVPDSTLHRLMQRVHTRALGRNPRRDRLSDWRTFQVLLTVAREGEGVPLSTQSGQSVELSKGVRIDAHPALQGRARLVPFEEGKRGLDSLSLPVAFRSHPELFQPFDLQPARGGDAGSNVIQLEEVVHPEVVTPAEPLIIHAEAGLGEDELILPVAYDPESQLFLPLGVGFERDGQVEIRIDRLPSPQADSRDIKGAIRMFLQKVAGEKIGAEKFGLEGFTSRLAAATLDEQGRVVYDDSPITLKQKAAAAQRILLFIHGFVGNTRGMVSSAYGLKDPQASSIAKLVDCYDLILTFDYENINTPIEETASHLKKALVAAGLGPDHGKTLHIAAHSLGTMVTRWFIERDSGSRFVQKALLIGPPNAGTPWAKYQDYLVVGLGAALNGLAAITWPTVVIPTLLSGLGFLVGGFEKIDATLDQIKPDSSFYRVLNESDDPGVQYVVIGGNTSKIPGLQPETVEAEKKLFQKLVERLTSAQTRNQILSLAFFNAPNDIAISIKSMSSLPADRSPAPVFVEVSCDHISYFSTATGLGKIVEALL
jgi:hypothetical protein